MEIRPDKTTFMVFYNFYPSYDLFFADDDLSIS